MLFVRGSSNVACGYQHCSNLFTSLSDCDLVALLEDDTGMELLVCNKIISLELPVKDVHRKIWCAEHNEVFWTSVLTVSLTLCAHDRPHYMHSIDTAYCCTCHMFHGLSVCCHTSEPCKNG